VSVHHATFATFLPPQYFAPPGIRWFGGNSNLDMLPRHGHGPPEQIIGGFDDVLLGGDGFAHYRLKLGAAKAARPRPLIITPPATASPSN